LVGVAEAQGIKEIWQTVGAGLNGWGTATVAGGMQGCSRSVTQQGERCPAGT